MSVRTNNPRDKVRELQRALYRAAKRAVHVLVCWRWKWSESRVIEKVMHGLMRRGWRLSHGVASEALSDERDSQRIGHAYGPQRQSFTLQFSGSPSQRERGWALRSARPQGDASHLKHNNQTTLLCQRKS